LQDMIKSQRVMNNLSILPIELSHIYALQSLQLYHIEAELLDRHYQVELGNEVISIGY